MLCSTIIAAPPTARVAHEFEFGSRIRFKGSEHPAKGYVCAPVSIVDDDRIRLVCADDASSDDRLCVMS